MNTARIGVSIPCESAREEDRHDARVALALFVAVHRSSSADGDMSAKRHGEQWAPVKR